MIPFGLHKAKWQSCLLLTEHLLHDTFATFTRVKNYTKSQLVQKMHKFLLYLYMIFEKNVYLCMQNEENGHIISIFPVADLRCRLYAIALSSFVRRNRRYGRLLSRPSQGIFGKNRQQRQQRVLQATGLQDKIPNHWRIFFAPRFRH